MSTNQLTSSAERVEPRRRLLALVKAEAFAPYVQRQGESYKLNVGDALWLEQNVNCQAACPVHTDAPRYIALVAGGDYDAAYAVNRQANVFPDILGRVCHRPCEDACRRGLVDEAVAICDLKRFAADNKSRVAEPAPQLEQRASGERVAVVGSGPAGLAAALDLAGWGYGVTVYEALQRPGGMLAVGVPPYRLPRRFVEAAVQEVRAVGAEVRLGVRVGEDVSLAKLKADHDAVLLAAGAHASLGLNVPGEEAEGVLRGLPFMVAINRQDSSLPQIEGRRVLVVGAAGGRRHVGLSPLAGRDAGHRGRGGCGGKRGRPFPLSGRAGASAGAGGARCRVRVRADRVGRARRERATSRCAAFWFRV